MSASLPGKTPYAEVIVDIAHADVNHGFTYRIPPGMTVRAGMRVSVPFGSRRVEGFVTGLLSQTDVAPAKLRDIIAPLEEYPALLPELMELAREISDTVPCTLAEALRLMLPAEMREGRVSVKAEKAAQLLVSGEELIKARTAQARAPRRRLLIDLLSDGEAHPIKELALLVRSPAQALAILAEQGVVRIFERETFRSPYPDGIVLEQDPKLTDEQQEVLGELLPALRRSEGSFVLHGVTGSGKTEVYIRLVRECLRLGKGAIVLTPEIILTPQMVHWFRARFGDVAAVLHSRLSAGERFDEWRRIRLGRARVVVGARSAVFAPVENLGLIVVDEEHEGTYVSDRHPRYDARDIAASRAKREHAIVLLASATPSIRSFAAAGQGEHMLLEMKSRVLNRPLAHVTVVDMREELRLGNTGIFSQELKRQLDACLSQGRQAMLFINRRGYAPSVVCRKCGHVMGCDSCDVSLTWHAADSLLHCHYCGSKTPFPSRCPECGSPYIRTCGVGTQRVEEEVRKLHPEVELVRMDVDTTAGKDRHRELLDRFRSGAARVMVGTQMIAKGLDFPQVTLVGAVLADLSVNLPDYRAAERSFQLLTQVAGRAGRADSPGEVIIQTYKPEHYAIAAAARQDYRSFFSMEYEHRRRGLYPPFTQLVRLLCEARDEESARGTSAGLHSRVMDFLSRRPELRKQVLFCREDEAPIKRMMGRARAQVFMKLVSHPDVQTILSALKGFAEEPWPAEVTLQVNPASLA